MRKEIRHVTASLDKLVLVRFAGTVCIAGGVRHRHLVVLVEFGRAMVQQALAQQGCISRIGDIDDRRAQEHRQREQEQDYLAA